MEAKPGNGGNVTAGKGKIRGLNIGLNLRHRYEARSQDFSRGRGTNYAGGAHGSRQPTKDFTIQRMRLSFDADINKNVMARVMFQDARTFGEHHNPDSMTTSSNITSNLQRTDVQEAYVQLRNLGDITLCSPMFSFVLDDGSRAMVTTGRLVLLDGPTRAGLMTVQRLCTRRIISG